MILLHVYIIIHSRTENNIVVGSGRACEEAGGIVLRVTIGVWTTLLEKP